MKEQRQYYEVGRIFILCSGTQPPMCCASFDSNVQSSVPPINMKLSKNHLLCLHSRWVVGKMVDIEPKKKTMKGKIKKEEHFVNHFLSTLF